VNFNNRRIKTGVGDRYENRFSQWCTVINYINTMEVMVIFDGHPKVEHIFPAGDLRKGSFRNKSDPVGLLGKRFKSNSGEFCTVVKCDSSKDILIEFDGYKGDYQQVKSGNLRKGQFLNKGSHNFKEGTRFKSKKGDWCTVVYYNNFSNICVVFDGYEDKTKLVRGDHLRSGGFKNNYKPLIYGVGYLGEGHLPSDSAFMKMVYATWKNMLARGYDSDTKAKQPTYEDVKVCEDWHCFNTFAEWMNSHKFKGLGYHLDKDLIIRGNSMYSSKNCTLLPQTLNLVITMKASNGKETPLGVYKSGKSFYTKMNIGGKGIKNLGRYKTPEEAHEVYVKAKERYIKNLALEWANRIEWRAFVSLMNWEVYPKEVV